MALQKLRLLRAWRAQAGNLIIFAIACLATIVFSKQYPQSIISGEIWRFGEHSYYINFPLFSLIPFFALIFSSWRVFDAEYNIDHRGIQSTNGLLSTRKSIKRVRYEDIRLVQVNQTILGRIFDFGNVEIGTAAVEGIEIVLEDIVHPAGVQNLIQTERDKRKKVVKDKEPGATEPQAVSSS
jgi:uncharacterized membrane protein YdbT with pleckstrin-like domain